METLTSSDGRTRTLHRLRPLLGEDGQLLFSMPGHGLVDFEVEARGEKLTLRCPLRCDGPAVARLRALAARDRGLGGRFFSEWRLLEGELVLFDALGWPVEVDVMVRPTPVGMPLADFVASAVVRGDTDAIRAAMQSFGELAVWARRMDRGVAPTKIVASPEGALSVIAFSADDWSERIFEMLQRAAEAPQNAGYDFGEGEGVRLVRDDGGGWRYVDGSGCAVVEGVWSHAAPFRAGRAEVETATGRGLIDTRGRELLAPVYEELVWDDRWGVVVAMRDGEWRLFDRDGRVLTADACDWIGECFEGLMLAVRDGRCGFLDVCGREAIPFMYDSASSFSEGCSVATLGPETFLVDRRGVRI
jgi:hypothetical protein